MAVSAPTPAVRLEERRWTVGEVERMVEAGILGEDEPLELLDGRLVVVGPQGARHPALIAQLTELLVASYAGSPWHLRVQMPLLADERSAPEPDLAVVRGSARDHRDRQPGAVDAILVVEVAVTAYTEAVRKTGVYAAAGAPTYWLIDVARRRVEVMEEPDPSGLYARSTIVTEDGELTLPGLAQTLPVGDLL